MLVALSSYRSAVGDQNAYKLSDKESENYDNVKKQYQIMLKNNADNMYKYYEFTQFKKAKFKCTKLNYKEETGKVDEIDFLFTGEIE